MKAWITISRVWYDRECFILEIVLSWQKLFFMTEDICLLKQSSESKKMPRFLTDGFMNGVRLPRSVKMGFLNLER